MALLRGLRVPRSRPLSQAKARPLRVIILGAPASGKGTQVRPPAPAPAPSAARCGRPDIPALHPRGPARC